MIPNSIVIHHSASSRDRTTFEDIERWHTVRWPDFVSSLGWHIGYHYVILGNGEIKQARRDNEIGAHCPPNDGRIGICLTGNFDVETPTEQQLSSLSTLLSKLQNEYQIQNTDVYVHRELRTTECPGNNLMIWILKNRQLSLLQKLKELLVKILGLKK